MADLDNEKVTVAEAAKRVGRYDAVIYGWITAGHLKKTRGKVLLAEVQRLSKERPKRGSAKKTKTRTTRSPTPATHVAKKLFETTPEDRLSVAKVAGLLKVLKPDGFKAEDYESMLVTVHSLASLVEVTETSV